MDSHHPCQHLPGNHGPTYNLRLEGGVERFCQRGTGRATNREGRMEPFVIVLGIAQDGGYPQAGCEKNCCERAWADPARRRRVAALGLADPETGGRWLFEATPDLREQLQQLGAGAAPHPVSGVFLTHAHIGHYSGLIHLGREVMGARHVPVYAMPQLAHYLSDNGPWDQLVSLGNIALRPLEDGVPVELGPRLAVEPLLVPHRGEYSETVAFRIRGPRRSVLFLPDIDQWDDWHLPLLELVGGNDVLFLDGTFFDEHELPGRNRREIPHPTIVETMDRLAPLSMKARAKVRFLHLNHTNPALDPEGEARREVQRRGFRIAEEGERITL